MKKPGIILLLACHLIAKGQISTVDFINYNINNGLSNNNVKTIMQDHRGFMWIGTSHGLNKYDGYQFTTFYHQPDNEKTISNSHVEVLFQDSLHQIWIGTRYGLNKYNPEDGSFIKYQHNPDNPYTISSNHILSITQDTLGHLWIGTKNGLNRLNKSQDGFLRFFHDTSTYLSLESNVVNALYTTKEGKLYCGTWNKGIYQIKFNKSFDRHVFKPLKFDTIMNMENPSINVKSIREDQKGYLLVATYGQGVFLYHQKNNKVIHYKHHPESKYQLSKNEANDILRDKNERLWIAVDNGGLNIIDPNTNDIQYIHHDYNALRSYQGFSSTCLYENNQNILWIGTRRGINILLEEHFEIKHYSQDITNPNTLSHNYVNAICLENDSIVWLGMEKGIINRFDRSKRRFKAYTIPNTLGIKEIKTTPMGMLVGASYDGNQTKTHFFSYNKRTDQFKSYLAKVNNKTFLIEDFYPDTNQAIIIGNNGLYRFDYHSKSFANISSTYHSKYNTASKSNHIEKDRHNNYWFMNDKSMIRYKLNSDSYTIFNLSNELDFQAHIFHILKDDIWIASNKGMIKFNISNNTKYHYPPPVESNIGNVAAIIPDKKGNIWTSNYKSVTKFNPKTGKYSFYDSWDFFKNMDFLHNSAAISSKNDIFIGGKNGFNVFNPDSIELDTVDYPVEITKISLMDNQDQQNIPLLHRHEKPIKISYDEVLSIEFALLNYSTPLQNRYAYKLEGIDKTWQYLGNKRTATFAHLPAGHYQFLYKASENKGNWHQGVPLKIEVSPPFWKRNSFRAGIIFLIAGIFLLVYYYRIKTMERRNKQLNKLVQKRTRELSEKNTELKELNSSKDKLFSVIGTDLNNPIDQVSDMAQKMIVNAGYYTPEDIIALSHQIDNTTEEARHLLNNLLNWAKINTDRLPYRPEQIDIQDIMHQNIEYFKPKAKAKDIRIMHEKSELICFIDVDMINAVIHNILSNAIKYTLSGGIIKINYKVKANDFDIIIEDTGVGMPESVVKELFTPYKKQESRDEIKQGTGLGLILCRDFLLKHHGDIEVRSVVDKGTTVIITLPR